MSDFTPRQIRLVDSNSEAIQRRWYQENFIAHRNAHLLSDETKQRILYSAPTGSGKSFMFLDALGTDPFAWGITNRLEIVADMLRKCGENVDSLSLNGLVDLAYEYRISTPVRYRNMLKNGEVPFLPWRLYIDECFVAGTLVDDIPIQQIKVGDTVNAFNEKTGEVTKRKVTKLYKNIAPEQLIKLTINGIVTVTTPNHPFMTPEGWKLAGDITIGDMCYMPEFVQTGKPTQIQNEIESTSVLYSGMREESNRCSIGEDNGKYESQVCVSTDESQQSDAQRRNSQESVSGSQEVRMQTTYSGRERPYINPGTDVSGSDRTGTTHCSDWSGSASGGTTSLQARLSRTSSDVSYRDRRDESLIFESSGCGQQERKISEWARVDNIEILQQESTGEFEQVCRDGHVYNIEVEGEHTYFANGIGVHNCHHDLANTFKDIYAFLPAVSVAGLTATPFRGTPRGTAEFHASWDRIVTILDIPTAAEQQIITIPEITIWPLVDDDEISVTAGEFTATSAGDMGITRNMELCRMIAAAGWIGSHYEDAVDWTGHTSIETPHWDKPTIFAVSTTEQANDLHSRCRSYGIPSAVITQSTSREERQRIFRDCVNCKLAIIQIDVVSEGVDLPIRRIIDMRPTFSPVRWLQLVGRSTRPRRVERLQLANGVSIERQETHSEYICCNRNLERHAYLMCGMLPASKIAEAQSAFGSLSQRSQTTRAVGTEGLGRLKPINIRFTDGTTGSVYNLYYMDGYVKKELAVLLHPNKQEPVIASRENVKKEDGTYAYGHWREIPAIPDVTGYASASGGVITEKQAASWCKHAASYGLDASVIPNRKNIQAYYLLRDLQYYKMRSN